MAVKLLTIRPRPTGTEVVLDDNGVERTLWRRGWWPDANADVSDQRDGLISWVTPILLGILESDTAKAENRAVDESIIDAQAFFTWLYKNRDKIQIRDALRPVALYYREEVD